MPLTFQTSDPMRVGSTILTIFKFKDSKSDLTINDLKRIQKKLQTDGDRKHKQCNIMLTKVYAHQWLTFTSEAKFDDYFDNAVKDSSKFKTFKEIQYYVYTQN
jgi:hypothetical protein